MKHIKLLYLGVAMSGVMALTGCQADMDAPGLEVPKATWEANTTIAELKEAMWSDDTNYAILCPEKDEATKEHYIIRGRVISSDASGNIYKSMYIQDGTAAITISINQNSLYNQYRIGQEVVIDATGLYIGKYAGLEQIGGYGEYNGTPQVSFMIYPKFTEHTQLDGLPDDNVTVINYGDPRPAQGMYCTNMSISQLPADNEGVRSMQSQLVEFRNVHFEKGGEDTYATYQQTESRNLVDEQGNTIVVRTSGYSNFYSQMLPTGTGTVRGLLSYFNGTWQLLLRSTADVMFDSKGQKEDPYTVDEAIAQQNMGTTGWVAGYIVGSVKGGVSAVASNDDIVWGRDAEMDNNLVIGETADTRDYTKCVVVELRSGSDFRRVGNLMDNPDNLGKAIKVRGTFAPLLGMAGVTGNLGSASEFEIDGVNPGGSTPGTGTGDGTQAKPFTVDQVLGGASGSEVWTEGYIVGWIDTNISLSVGADNCMFNSNCTVPSNMLIAATPSETNYAKCVPVQLSAGTDPRAKLNLMDNPGNLGAKVALKGNLEKYFGVAGVKSVTEFTLNGSGGGGTTPDPNPGTTPDLKDAVNLAASAATNFQGTHEAEEPKTDTSNGHAERWQPLTGLSIGSYNFTFTSGTGTATAWYGVMSTATSGTPTLRFYTGSTMTVMAPAGTTIAKIVMNGSNANNSLSVTSSAGTCVRDGNNVTWTSSTGVTSVTFTFSATYRVNSFDVYAVK